MTFNPQRAEALRTAIFQTLDWLRIHPTGGTGTLLTEHLALLHEAELIYLTDAFVGEGESASDPHAELRKTWAPGQRWQCRAPGESEWCDIDDFGLRCQPSWDADCEYRSHPDDIDHSPKPWYPDDSGEWVEVPDDQVGCPVHADTRIEYLCARERLRKEWSTDQQAADQLSWGLSTEHGGRIVAYKVVR